MKMKKIKDPEKLFIQISDENKEKFGISFCCETPCDENVLDPNEFSEETKDRVLHLLATSYRYLKDNF